MKSYCSYLVLVLALTACGQSQPEFTKGAFHIYRVEQEAEIDNKIPAALWDKIEAVQASSFIDVTDEADGEETAEDESGDSEQQGQAEANSELRLKKFMSVQIYLKEKTLGVLGKKNHQIDFPPGGGNLDLGQYVAADRGSYHVGFVSAFPEEIDNLRVYFSGQSKLRRLEGRIWGTGCRKFADVTNFFKDELSQEGLVANATDRRDVSLLAGSYVFVLPRKDGLYLAQVGIYDSRVPRYHCSTSPVHQTGKVD